MAKLLYGLQPDLIDNIRVHQTAYGVTVESFEWQISLLMSSGQDGTTPWSVTLASIDGGMKTTSGRVQTDVELLINEINNMTVCNLLNKWLTEHGIMCMDRVLKEFEARIRYFCG